jgi:hypothetical protein
MNDIDEIPYPIENKIYYNKLGDEDLIAIYKLYNDFTQGTTLDYFVQFKESTDQLDFRFINSDDNLDEQAIINKHYSDLFNTKYYGVVCNQKDIKLLIDFIVDYYSEEYDINMTELQTKLGANIL